MFIQDEGSPPKAMSRRIVVEEPCEHGFAEEHPTFPPSVPSGWHIDCPGGFRTVLEGIPEIWWCVEHEANGFDTYCHRALAWDIAHDDENEKTMPNCRMELRGLVVAVFGETP